MVHGLEYWDAALLCLNEGNVLWNRSLAVEQKVEAEFVQLHSWVVFVDLWWEAKFLHVNTFIIIILVK